ncbi:MAG: hypothetical protein ABI959_05515 [Candidatus Dormiibacterota bacterium]
MRIVASTGREVGAGGGSAAGGVVAGDGADVAGFSSGAQSGIGVCCGFGGVSGVRPGSAISLGA